MIQNNKIFSIILVLFFYATNTCMEMAIDVAINNATETFRLILPWISKKETVIHAMHEAYTSENGIAVITAHNVEARFNASNCIVDLSSPQWRDSIPYEFFLENLGIPESERAFLADLYPKQEPPSKKCTIQ